MKVKQSKKDQSLNLIENYFVETSLDFNYVKPCFDLLHFKFKLLTLGQKDFLI